MPRSDPLQLLRSCYNQKLQKRVHIRQKGGQLIIDKQKLPLDTQTAWITQKSQKQLTLGTIWYYLQNGKDAALKRDQYFSKAAQLKVDIVNVADGQEIIRYFTGQKDQTNCINNQLRLTLLTQKAKTRDKPETGHEHNDGKGQKKIKTQKLDQHSQKLFDCIKHLQAHQIQICKFKQSLCYPYSQFAQLRQFISNHSKQYQTNKVQVPSQQQQIKKTRCQQIYSKKNGIPIIIVPQNTIPGNVSLDNAKKFLLEGEYDQYAKRQNPNASRFQLMKELRGKKRQFQINCRPNLLSQQNWKNVVAVFVMGRQNQFDDWPHKNHKKSLQNCAAFLVKFPKTSSGSASQWKCSIKILDPISRTSDKQVVKSIWVEIQNCLFAPVE